MDGCGVVEQEEEMAIIYPKRNSSIYVPLNFNEEREKVVLEATHIIKDMKLFWHMDNTYLGETEIIHEMSIIPSEGEHTLTVMDEKGNSRVVKFEVIGRD